MPLLGSHSRPRVRPARTRGRAAKPGRLCELPVAKGRTPDNNLTFALRKQLERKPRGNEHHIGNYLPRGFVRRAFAGDRDRGVPWPVSWFVDMPSAGRWLVTLGVSALFLLLASTCRRRGSGSSSIRAALTAAGPMLASTALALLWMWTLEPVRIELVRVAMSLALALGLGSLLFSRPRPSAQRQISAAATAGVLLCVLTVVLIEAY